MDLTTLHLASLIVTAPVILWADHMGFNYFTGKVETLSARKVRIAHWLVIVGLILLIVTGVILTVPMWAIMLEKPLFYTKLAFVATLVVNGVFIDKLMHKATQVPYKNLSKDEKIFLFTSGVISVCGWVGSTLIGFFGL